MPDNQHRKLYSKTYYSRQANLHYSNRMDTAQTAFVLFRCLNGCLL